MGAKIIYTYCDECGKEINRKGMRTCPNCGTLLKYPNSNNQDKNEEEKKVEKPNPVNEKKDNTESQKPIPQTVIKPAEEVKDIDDVQDIDEREPVLDPDETEHVTDIDNFFDENFEDDVVDTSDFEEPNFDDDVTEGFEDEFEDTVSFEDEIPDVDIEADTFNSSEETADNVEDNSPADGNEEDDLWSGIDFDVDFADEAEPESTTIPKAPAKDSKPSLSEQPKKSTPAPKAESETEVDDDWDDWDDWNEDEQTEESNKGEESNEDLKPTPSAANRNRDVGTATTKKTQKTNKQSSFLEAAVSGKMIKKAVEKNEQKKASASSTEKASESSKKKAKDIYDPNHDGYYNDVEPEYNDVIFKVPVDIFIKAVFMTIAVAASILYFVYNL